jgi:hypothetical protein
MKKNTKKIYQDGEFIPEGKKIYLYKKGSRGELMGVYESIKDIEIVEKYYYPKFRKNLVYSCLRGNSNSFTSYHHQCRVKAVLR